MRCSRLATELPGVLAAETSVVINLNATGCAETILRDMPFRLVITDAVFAELQEDRRTARSDATLVTNLLQQGLINQVTLGPLGEQVFADLVIGPAQTTLDDGEASTIAYAVEHH